jgi:hypothetical protein
MGAAYDPPPAATPPSAGGRPCTRALRPPRVSAKCARGDARGVARHRRRSPHPRGAVAAGLGRTFEAVTPTEARIATRLVSLVLLAHAHREQLLEVAHTGGKHCKACCALRLLNGCPPTHGLCTNVAMAHAAPWRPLPLRLPLARCGVPARMAFVDVSPCAAANRWLGFAAHDGLYIFTVAAFDLPVCGNTCGRPQGLPNWACSLLSLVQPLTQVTPMSTQARVLAVVEHDALSPYPFPRTHLSLRLRQLSAACPLRVLQLAHTTHTLS